MSDLDGLKSAMISRAARDLRAYLVANGIDPTIVNPEGAAYSMVNAIEGESRVYVWRDLVAMNGGPQAGGSGLDRDAPALAWARAKVQHHIDKLRRWQREAAEQGKDEQSRRWRNVANHLDRTFIGGTGCVVASFDARLPQVLAASDSVTSPKDAQ